MKIKPVEWVGSSRKDLSDMPKAVRCDFAFALYEAQKGNTHSDVKPLKGFGGNSVVEVREDFDGDTYRAVYTARFEEAIYVLHVFQKKSKTGIKTPKADIDLIKQRLKTAEEMHNNIERKKQ